MFTFLTRGGQRFFAPPLYKYDAMTPLSAYVAESRRTHLTMTSSRYALTTSSRRMHVRARANSLAGEASLPWRRCRDVIQPLSITRACSASHVIVVRTCEMSHSVTPRVRARRVQSPSTAVAMSVRRSSGEAGDMKESPITAPSSAASTQR